MDDYKKVVYYTNAGRSWNSTGVSVRDKVDSGFDIAVNSTQHFISLAKENRLPNKIIINTHPQRWFDPGFGWYKELILQNLKNQVKRLIVKRK